MSTAEHSEDKRTLLDYCERFSELKVSSNRKRGDAPYKPILLLSIIDLIAQGIIKNNYISISDELIETFNKYWKILGNPAYKGGLHYPFFHLQSDIFWHLKLNHEFKGLQPKTTNKLKEAVEYAKLDDELFELLLDKNSRNELTDTLIAVWFFESQRELSAILNVNQSFQSQIEEDVEEVSLKQFKLQKSVVRNAFFRKAVVHTYGYRCAFCGLKVTRKITQSIVDGAHIKPFSKFYDSRIDNGISFCKNHHWAFDRGWFTINDDYKIVVANDLQEVSPNAKSMRDFHGEHIALPVLEEYFPRLDALDWHRKNIFRV
jgi:putative restriction endonuclease